MGDHLKHLRVTVSVDAPARLVCGAVVELATRRSELVDIDESGMTAVLLHGPFRGARLTARCAGALLTCELEWVGRGALLDVFSLRGPALSLLTAVAEGARARAESLAGARVVVGTAIVRDGRLLAQQRGFPADVAGMWELPGGRVEPGESDRDAVRRECQEELAVHVEPGEPAGPDIVLPGDKVLRIYRAVTSGDPVAVEHRALRWLSAAELADVDWLPADRLLVPVFRALVGG